MTYRPAELSGLVIPIDFTYDDGTIRMMFAELIAESLHSMADLTWNIQSFDPGLATARFEIKDVPVEVRFEERRDWTVSLEVLYGASQGVYYAFHIYNAVFQAVEEFLATRQPDVLVFVTKREELAEVYDLYLRKGQEKIVELGYRLRPMSTIDQDREHPLVRVEPSQWTQVSARLEISERSLPVSDSLTSCRFLHGADISSR